MKSGTQKNLEKLNKLLSQTDIHFVVRNQDGSLSKIELQRVGYKLKRKHYIFNNQTPLDADYELVFNLERKLKGGSSE